MIDFNSTMKRRRFVQSLMAAPAVPALLAQRPAPPASANGEGAKLPALSEIKLDTGSVDEAGGTVVRFFSAQQLAALRKLGNMIMPSINGAPSAADAGAAEFLDFLIGQSLAERQVRYRLGLDQLNDRAIRQFNKPFADIDDAQANTLLEPLRAAWTFDPPADAYARFLREAKQDIRTATMNSREFVTASAGGGGGRRGGGGGGLYWYPID